MSDEGFDFRRPASRRESKQFEPPPWEREAFEEMQRRRADQGENPAEAERPSPSPEEPETPPPPVRRHEADGSEASRLDEAQLIEMMAGLAEEDPPAQREYFAVAMGAALFMAALGAVLLVWGVAALVGARRTGAFGTFAGTGLALFGAGFLAGGIWMAYQALKRRGVL